MTLADLDTPSLILDRSVLDRNAAAMTGRAHALGVKLRPHLKTAKSADVAKIAVKDNFGGITVSTLKEAEYFAAAGFSDIVYAVSIVPAKLPRIASLLRSGVDLAVVTDRIDVARALGEKCVQLGVEVPVMIELDTGEHRSGLAPDSDEVVPLGALLHGSPGVSLRGVLTHAGHSYGCRSIEAVRDVAEQERAATVGAAQRLRAAGLPCPVVSVGSTPTAVHARNLEGVTELRCGVYMFGDVFQSEIHSCGRGDIAVSVLATVIGHREDLGCALIDAGALALSKDRSTGAEGLPEDVGFGLVTDADGRERIDGMRVNRVYQEHGLIGCDGAFPFHRLPIGTRVRVFPNHVCLTAAMYDAYQVIDGGDEVVATWPRINGW
jgi:D-serine deaminase-like pyridoxal phosphate-dependent protein